MGKNWYKPDTTTDTREKATADYKDRVLGRLFPSIRYDSDVDLERYIVLRKGGKPSQEWQPYYQNLIEKYTEDERKKLIRALRKNWGNFRIIFNFIIDQLFKRIVRLLRKKIDQILKVYRDIEKISLGKNGKNQNVLGKIEMIVNLCTGDRYQVLDNIRFLTDFAKYDNYKLAKLKQVHALLQGYFDGTLFAEAEASEPYRFDIKEERKKYKKLKQSQEKGVFRLKIFITRDDINNILINNNNLNEYELSFAYMEKYLEYIENHEFASKVFVYSKKHRTQHFHIYNAIKRGFFNKFDKERIFFDIFKIICEGRYVFDITMEKHISRNLRIIGQPQIVIPQKKQKQVLVQKLVKEKIPPGKVIKKKRKRIKVKKHRTKPVSVKQQQPEFEKPYTEKIAASAIPLLKQGKSVSEMIQDISRNRRIQVKLLHAFKSRLSSYIIESVGIKKYELTENSEKIKTIKNLIHYVLNNYDNILTKHTEEIVYKQKIENLGYSIYNIYTLIIQCFTEVKTDYLTGKLKIKRGWSPFKRFRIQGQV